MSAPSLEYSGLAGADGPLVFVEGIEGVAFNELVELTDPEGRSPEDQIRLGQVLDISQKRAVVQLFAGTSGLSLRAVSARFTGETLKIPVADEMLGRIFDGFGRPKDGLPQVIADQWRDVNGEAINPYSRRYPRDFIQTGITSIDLMNTLVRGQKLPIFSGTGMPHNHIAAQIARQARLISQEIDFAIVFAAMGVNYDVANFFIDSFEKSGAINQVAMFLSLASDPSVERLVTPRSALTLAEYLAYERNMHVLVILTDMTNYCEALREVATARGEIPSRKGYPGYLYSDLASLYERAGRVEGSEGSITQMPILTMPNDDISHPIPDLTGYVTEGQIVLDREMFQKGAYPPVAGLPSLSRLMKDGIGKGRTRDDHPRLAAQLFSAYARVKDIRALASVVGKEELSPLDKLYLEFGDRFETSLVAQGEYENRSIEESCDIGWELLKILPRGELHHLQEADLQTYYDETIEHAPQVDTGAPNPYGIATQSTQ